MKQREAAPAGPPEAPPGPDWLAWLDLVPAIWLVIVISAYALIVIFPEYTRQPAQPIPGIAEMERAAGPLLFSLGVAAIIRYFLTRQTEGSERSDAAVPRPDGGRETA